MSLRTRRGLSLLASLMFVAAACQPGATQPPTSPGSPGTSPTGGATGAAEQTLTYALDGDMSLLTNALSDVPTAEAAQWLYSAIYRYDAALTPVPDLAKEPAKISADGLTWTITLVDNAYFSDGGNVTADDVVFTYEIAKSPNCRFNPSVCLADFLDSVTKIDERTVEFKLKQKYAPFATVNLPGIFIDSKKAVEASYAKFQSGQQNVTAAEVKALADKAGAEGADLGALAPEMEALLQKAGLTLPDKATFVGEDGSPDAAAYGTALSGILADLNATFAAPEADKVAAAYPLLDIGRSPVGSGPFKLETFRPGQDLTFVANDKYHFGKPQISRMFLPIIKNDVAAANALKSGSVDWKFSLTADAYSALKDDPNIKFAEYPDFGNFEIQFNLREGRLFADKALRQAMAWCIDKEATVQAATNGQGIAIYGDIPPASWAYNPNVEKYQPRDVAKAKSLIEGAGWTLGSDGIYEKGGKKLSTEVLVRAGKEDRIKFMQLTADQVKECGMELKVKEADFQAVLIPMLTTFPHIPAGSKEPFDAYFGGWGTGFDPDPYSLFHSSQCTTKEKPDLNNYGCFKNAEADKLIEDGLVELDQAKRAEIYKRFEEIVAEELPYLFAWSDIAREALAKSVNSTGGEFTPENMDTPTFFWEMEKITNIKQ
ncbi:MAG TPA: ABC transporter substrate-binding protein [Candidatus Limnocylindrales bacterium]|nr:ABC transporter substrate-binding protein [Candidatus Limnocylindrales bacterium]